MSGANPSVVDAAVVGGGPAGAAAALMLARAGWRTTLIERGPRFRGKTCGGCLSPRTLRALRHWSIIDPATIAAWQTTDEIDVRTGDVARFRAPLIDATGHAGRAISRPRFDQALIDAADAAGVHVVQPAAARVVRIGRDGADLVVSSGGASHMLHARLLVGADGLRSAIARSAGLLDPPPARRQGVKFGFAFDLSADGFERLRARTISMFVVPGGYVGLARTTPGRMHVAALVGWPDRAARDPVSFCRGVGARFPQLRLISSLARSDMDGFCATGPMACSPVAAGRGCVALVGDAAGYIEPFTGEGIAWALESAELLASVATRVRPGEWRDDLALEYHRLWRGRIGWMHRRCQAIGFALERPVLAGALCRVSRMLPAVAGRVVRSVVAA